MRLVAPDAVAVRELPADRFDWETLPLWEINFHEVIAVTQGWLILTILAKDSHDDVRRLPRAPERAADYRINTLGYQMTAHFHGCRGTAVSQYRFVTTPLISLLHIKRTLRMPYDEHPNPARVVGISRRFKL